ncbi:MAG TPA: hypothetical protein DIC34_09625, partial [Treponema sp.]|nr:hypothetical protein [Treponema sp.]
QQAVAAQAVAAQAASARTEDRTTIDEPALPDIEDLPDLELDTDEGDAFLTDAEPLDIPPLDSDLPSFEDIASFDEELGEESPTTSDDFTELSMDDFLEGADFSPEGSAASELSPTEEAPMDMDLDFNDGLEGETGNFDLDVSGGDEPTDSVSSVSLETVSDFDDFLSELSTGAPAESEKAPETAAAATDLEELEMDIEDAGMDSGPEIQDSRDSFSVELSSSDGETEFAEEPRRIDSPAPSSEVSLSTQLLMRIAEELSSIKNEISSLKGELSSLRMEAKPEPAASADEPKAAAHGFFDEEDDEKIALTGDELDNILNTADFTEEAGSDAGGEALDLGAGLDDQEVIEEFLSDRKDLLPAEDETIEQLREEGVRPMTFPPEDTSYLDADLPPNPDELDLSDAVIEEPDLGGAVLQEPPIEEPAFDSIDIDLDLDLEEALHVESSEDESSGGIEELGLTEDGEIELMLDDSEPASPVEEAEAMGVSVESVEALEEDIGSIGFQEDILEPEEISGEENFSEILPEGFIVDSEATETAPDFQTVDELEEEKIADESEPLPDNLRHEVKTVLSYMDQLLESLPEDKIEEFAKSEYFDTYKKLFEELGLA